VDPERGCPESARRSACRNHGDRDNQHDELREPGDLSSKEEEQRRDTNDAEEQQAEKAQP
jgi:hypothetical protein